MKHLDHLLVELKTNFCLGMPEAKTGKVNIDDFNAGTVETMVYFLYNDNVLDEKMINPDLLRLAEKYNIKSLMDFCSEYLEENLSLENALDVLVTSHVTKKTGVFDNAAKFVCENRGHLIKTDSWKELLETNQKLANDVLITMLKLE